MAWASFRDWTPGMIGVRRQCGSSGFVCSIKTTNFIFSLGVNTLNARKPELSEQHLKPI